MGRGLCDLSPLFPHSEPQFLHLAPLQTPWAWGPVWRDEELSRSLDGWEGWPRLAEPSER